MLATEIVRHPNLTGQVYERLKRSILDREVAPGSELVVRRVAKQLGVSLTPVREAMRLIEKDGLVTFTPNKGAVVIEAGLAQFKDAFVVRRELEGLAARLACPVLTPDDLLQLAAILERGRASIPAANEAQWIESDEQFHHLLSDKAGNPLLSEMLERLMDRVRLFRKATIKFPGRVIRAAREHEAVLAALKRRDAATAEQRMIEHIDNTLTYVLTEERITEAPTP